MTKLNVNPTDWVRDALERYERALVAYALRFTGNLDQARDIVQDTFIRLCTADRAKVDGHLAAWLYTVCRNRALDVLTKEGRMQALLPGQAEACVSPQPGPRDLAERHETHNLVLEILSTLPEKHQELFRLKFQDGFTYREISQITGTPTSTVSNHLHEALAAVREGLRARFGVTPEIR